MLGSKKRGEATGDDDNGPTELWVYLSFMTQHPDIDDLVQSFNIDISPDEGIYCTVKTVQCWKSDARYILVCVNNHLCTLGVRSTLPGTFTDVRRKLCRRGKLDTVDWYDKPIPDFHVYARKMKPMRGIPETEREELGFDLYPGTQVTPTLLSTLRPRKMLGTSWNRLLIISLTLTSSARLLVQAHTSKGTQMA
jgi:hypothetical protein